MGKKSAKGSNKTKGKNTAPPPANQPRQDHAAPPPPPPISLKSNPNVVPLRGTSIFQVESALSVCESRAFIEYAETLGFASQGSKGAAYGEAFRDNDRVAINDPSLASALWEKTGLREIFAEIVVGKLKAIGLNPNLRFYRYSPGQKFGRHIDESVSTGPGECTLFTLLVYLSGAPAPGSNVKRKNGEEALVGGETVFYGNKNRVLASVTPTVGLALLHIHGDDCNEHEAMEVRRGVKYVLRSDVLFKA
ncbi:hypothetical protein BSKO_11822 [Bryopsis sp. KO-2023]|nr:hypothetical protein BSKO_11822 [Bryopsis sp. KO-2023]